MERQGLFSFFLIFLVSLILAASFFILLPFIQPILWAVIFAIISWPLFKTVRRIIKRNTLSSIFMSMLVLFAFIVPVTVVGILSMKEAVELIKQAIVFYKKFSIEEAQSKFFSLPFIKTVLSVLPPEKLKAIVIDQLKMLANFSASQFKSLFLTTGLSVFKLFIFIFTYFFLIKDAENFIGYIVRFIPLEEEDKKRILGTIYLTTLGVVYGTIGTAIVQGAIGLLLYWIFSVPYPFVWALATAYASFIPPFGASMVWFPLSIYIFMKVSMIKGVILAILSALLISTTDNIIKPLVMKNRVNTPYIILFFSIFGGLLKFGFIGMFIGPIIFNLAFTLLKIYEEHFLA